MPSLPSTYSLVTAVDLHFHLEASRSSAGGLGLLGIKASRLLDLPSSSKLLLPATSEEIEAFVGNARCVRACVLRLLTCSQLTVPQRGGY